MGDGVYVYHCLNLGRRRRDAMSDSLPLEHLTNRSGPSPELATLLALSRFKDDRACCMRPDDLNGVD